VHFVLEEFKMSLKSSLSTQSLCHTVNTRVGVGSLILGPESESHKKRRLRIPAYNDESNWIRIKLS